MSEPTFDINAVAARFGGLETYGQTCPYCGQPIYRFRGIDKRTGHHHGGACMNVQCPMHKKNPNGTGSTGYKLPDPEDGAPKKAPSIEAISRKNVAVGYYLKYGVWSSDLIIAKDLHNFSVTNDAQKRLVQFANGIVNQVVQGKTVHALIVGSPGVGKSHIANGILIAAQEKSSYNIKTMFVDLQLLLSQRKQAMHDHPDVQAKVDETLRQLGIADLIVLDDLGAERGTDYDQDLVKEIFRLREEKSMVITTNLTGPQLTAMYDARTMSRMAMHGQGNTFAVKGIADHRRGEKNE